MTTWWPQWLGRQDSYLRKPPLVLVSGLAEQQETWFANAGYWRNYFDVHMPALAPYDGDVLHEWLAAGKPVDVDFLVERLGLYLDHFVQSAPYDLAANSMGGKVAVEFALRYPTKIRRLVLLCPSGLAEEERLPIVAGVRRSDLTSMVGAVFRDRAKGQRSIVAYYESRFQNKRWRSGLVRTIRGTRMHTVHRRLGEITQPTLLVIGEQDRIVDPHQSAQAGKTLKHGRVILLPRCGHAPQIEKAALVNRLVANFLRDKGSKTCNL